MARHLTLLGLAPLVLACTGKPGPGDASVTIGDVTAEVSPVIPTVVTVTWTTDVASVGYVRFGDGLTTPTESVAATEHSAVLLGLHMQTAVDYQVVVQAEEGDITSDTASGFFRSNAAILLLRNMLAAYSDLPLTVSPSWRIGSPSTASILTTSAPKSASRRAQNGPAAVDPSSSTR